jgi:hypothetical protein
METDWLILSCSDKLFRHQNHHIETAPILLKYKRRFLSYILLKINTKANNFIHIIAKTSIVKKVN